MELNVETLKEELQEMEEFWGACRTEKVLSVMDVFLKDVCFLLAEFTRRNSP